MNHASHASHAFHVQLFQQTGANVFIQVMMMIFLSIPCHLCLLATLVGTADNHSFWEFRVLYINSNILDPPRVVGNMIFQLVFHVTVAVEWCWVYIFLYRSSPCHTSEFCYKHLGTTIFPTVWHYWVDEKSVGICGLSLQKYAGPCRVHTQDVCMPAGVGMAGMASTSPRKTGTPGWLGGWGGLVDFNTSLKEAYKKKNVLELCFF